MDDHLSALFDDGPGDKTPTITPRLSRPITALAIRPDIDDDEARHTIMPRIDQHATHPYIR